MREIKIDEQLVNEKIRVLFGRKLSHTIFASKYMSVFKGRGMEFESFRDYIIGDDADLIDWKASKRANKILVREYTTEKEIDVLIMFDISSSMYYSSIDKLKVEYSVEMVMALSYLAMQMGSKVGLIMFSDKIHHFLPLGAGAMHNNFITGMLKDPKNYPGGKANLSRAFNFARQFLKKNTVIIVISDFLQLDKFWKHSFSVMSYRYDVIGFIIRDKTDREIPRGGFLRVVDPYSNEELIVNTDSTAKKYNLLMKQNEKDLHEFFLSHNSDYLLLDTSQDFFDPIISFLKRRSSTSK